MGKSPAETCSPIVQVPFPSFVFYSSLFLTRVDTLPGRQNTPSVELDPHLSPFPPPTVCGDSPFLHVPSPLFSLLAFVRSYATHDHVKNKLCSDRASFRLFFLSKEFMPFSNAHFPAFFFCAGRCVQCRGRVKPSLSSLFPCWFYPRSVFEKPASSFFHPVRRKDFILFFSHASRILLLLFGSRTAKAPSFDVPTSIFRHAFDHPRPLGAYVTRLNWDLETFLPLLRMPTHGAVRLEVSPRLFFRVPIRKETR